MEEAPEAMSCQSVAQQAAIRARRARDAFATSWENTINTRNEADNACEQALRLVYQENYELRGQNGHYQQHINDTVSNLRKLEDANAQYAEANNQLLAERENYIKEVERLARLAEARAEEIGDFELRYSDKVRKWAEMRTEK